MDIKNELLKTFKLDYESHLKLNNRDNFSFNPEFDFIPDYLFLFLQKSEHIPLKEKVELMRYYDYVLRESLKFTISDASELNGFISRAEAMLHFVDQVAFKYHKIQGETLLFVNNNIPNFKLFNTNIPNMNYVTLHQIFGLN